MEIGETWGETLKKLRNKAKFTQSKLADYLHDNNIWAGIDKTWISRFENSKRFPSRDQAISFVIAFSKLKTLTASNIANAWLDQDGNLGALAPREIKKFFPNEQFAPPSDRQIPGPIPTIIPRPRAKVFVGREAEIKWVKERLLAGNEAALVGVKAIGGMGKTELAIAVMQDDVVKRAFPGGIFWLECGALPAEAVQERLAEALGMELTSTELPNRAAALSLALTQRKKALLVLDDMRRHHIAEFSYLKPGSPNCAVLVTSRRDDLPLADSAVKKLDVLPEKKGEELLISLLQDSTITLNGGLIVAIAKLLEQIPLALTLAAGRAKRIAKHNQADPLAELLGDLKQRRLDAIEMSNASKDLSVRITFDASYGDLNETEQWWLAQLGLFARNSFDLETICWIWELDASPAKTAMEQLIFAGLVEQTGKSQYWMHDLLREYAGDCLTKFPREKQNGARLRYAEFWKMNLENIELSSIADWEALFSNRAEIEQAANWLLNRWELDPNLSAELTVEISQTLQSYSIIVWENWLKKGMAAAKNANLKNAARRLQRSLGEYYQMKGEVSKAEDFLRASLSTAEKILTEATKEKDAEGVDDGRRGVAVTQVGLADLMVAKGNWAEAEAAYRGCLGIFQQLKDAYSFGAAQTRLGQLYLQQNRQEEAIEVLQSARELFVKLQAAPWIDDIDQLLSQARNKLGSLDGLVSLIKAAQKGDEAAGKQAWAHCDALHNDPDPTLAVLGAALRRVLIGIPARQALVDLPAELKESLLAAFS